jgi:hypothetical protein
MPEFILDHGTPEATTKFRALDSFTQGYIEAMFFTSTGTGDDEDLQDASVAELAPETWQLIREDCAKFQADNATLLETANAVRAGLVMEYDDESAGRDFWYSRNGHGVGFWDRGLGEIGDVLTTKAQSYHEIDLYRGDDGLLYLA